MTEPKDEVFMRAALKQAYLALQGGEVPIGAVLVKGDEIIASAHNSPIGLHDPSAHAEIVVLRQAGARLKNYRLPHTSLYVTVEPCIMCVGSMIQARIERLVFGASDPKAGAAGSLINLASWEKLNHRLRVSSGLLAEECRAIIQEFFQKKRSQINTGDNVPACS